MAEIIAHNMAPIMFASLVVFLLLGYPVAFSLSAVGLFYFVIGVELAPLSHGEISLSWPLLQSLPERLYGIMNNDVLLAIPFFTLMGLILERSGMAEDLLDTIGQLFGTVRGGLAYAVIFVGAKHVHRVAPRWFVLPCTTQDGQPDHDFFFRLSVSHTICVEMLASSSPSGRFVEYSSVKLLAPLKYHDNAVIWSSVMSCKPVIRTTKLPVSSMRPDCISCSSRLKSSLMMGSEA